MLSILRETIIFLVFAIGVCVGASATGAASGFLTLYLWSGSHLWRDGHLSQLTWVSAFSLAGLVFGVLLVMLSSNESSHRDQTRRFKSALRIDTGLPKLQ